MSNKTKVKLLLVKPILTKEEIKEKEGDYFDEHHYTKHNKVITNEVNPYEEWQEERKNAKGVGSGL